jgi:phosphoglycerate dehydrogenase-like enzyme
VKIAVLDDYQNLALGHADWSRIANAHDLVVFDRHLSQEEAAQALRPFDVVCHIRERMAFPRTLIDALPDLKLIVVTGRAHRTLDLDAATQRKIPVCHTDGRPGLEAATPELTWGLILSALRHIPREAAQMATGGWQTTVGTTLEGKTLGLLGLGRLGRRVARYGAAFGMRVIAWSSNLTPDAAREGGAERVSKEEVFRQSDVVSIHLVLGERSMGLVGAAELGLMKPGALLVNTSRGPIVQTGPLLDALGRGAIRAAIDVYDQEPLPADDPLRSAPNCLLTPHLGYVTTETFRAFFEDVVADIEAYASGRPIRVLNPQALAQG